MLCVLTLPAAVAFISNALQVTVPSFVQTDARLIQNCIGQLLSSLVLTCASQVLNCLMSPNVLNLLLCLVTDAVIIQLSILY